MHALIRALTVAFHRQCATWAVIFNRTEAALRHWEAVRALRPHDPDVLGALAHLRAQLGQREAALALLGQVVQVAPDRAAAWFNLAFMRQEGGLHLEALEAFDRALALDDRLDRAWYGKALSLIKLGRVEESIPLLTKNTELQPMSPYGWYQLAHAYHRLGRPDRVEKVIRKLAGFEPKVAQQLERETGVRVGVETPF